MFHGQNFRYSGRSGHGTPLPPAGPQFYVNPTTLGTGDGLSAANAARFSAIWAIIAGSAGLGPEINVLGTDPATDGHYTGANSMIAPPAGTAGAAGFPIIIRAVNDGAVWIDGEGARNPVDIDGPTNRNDYITLQGMDFSNALATCVRVSSNHFTMKRCCAWDSSDTENTHVIHILGTSHFDPINGCNALLEDVAAFGLGRKSIENFSNNGPNIFRRVYCRWEKSIASSGPKRTIQTFYHSANLTIDNAIFRVSSLLPASYVLMNGAVPAAYPGDTTCTQGAKNVPIVGECSFPGPSITNDSLISSGSGYNGENEYNPAAMPGGDGANVNGNGVFSGTLILQLSGEPIALMTGATRGMWEHKTFGNNTIQNAFVYLAPGVVDQYRLTGADYRSFSLAATADDTHGHVAAQCRLTNATSIAPDALTDTISAKWTVSGKITGTTLASVGLVVDTNVAGQQTFYRGTTGAKMRYRYLNGSLTTTALWPWPMGDRILAATTRASTDGHGHVIEDINATVQATFGNFPTVVP